jgi:hypothetical protein
MVSVETIRTQSTTQRWIRPNVKISEIGTAPGTSDLTTREFHFTRNPQQRHRTMNIILDQQVGDKTIMSGLCRSCAPTMAHRAFAEVPSNVILVCRYCHKVYPNNAAEAWAQHEATLNANTATTATTHEDRTNDSAIASTAEVIERTAALTITQDEIDERTRLDDVKHQIMQKVCAEWGVKVPETHPGPMGYGWGTVAAFHRHWARQRTQYEEEEGQAFGPEETHQREIHKKAGEEMWAEEARKAALWRIQKAEERAAEQAAREAKRRYPPN